MTNWTIVRMMKQARQFQRMEAKEPIVGLPAPRAGQPRVRAQSR